MVGLRAKQRAEVAGGSGPAVGKARVLPAGQGGACLLADNGIATEDLAAQLLPLLGSPGSTLVRHAVPGGAMGTVGGCQRGPGMGT